MALGLVATLSALVIEVAGPGVSCPQPVPGVIVLGAWLALAGGLIQIVPLAIVLSARRRWRTTLALSGSLLVFGLIRGILLGDLVVTLVGVAGVGWAFVLRRRAAKDSAAPGLSVLETNVFGAVALVLLPASFFLALLLILRNLCMHGA
ncbi:MAG TPA: hypothetical protein VJT14_09610 [Candidatus Dormibacteraeota bacterium]|nr:hypothetical protein [Candidatus Dormibacteraeota bacterium]